MKTGPGFCALSGDWLDEIVARGYVDTFRHLYPDTVKYSWWTYRFGARERNAGWRIDYFFVTRDLIDNDRVKAAFIDNDIFGSDHCPVGWSWNFKEEWVWLKSWQFTEAREDKGIPRSCCRVPWQAPGMRARKWMKYFKGL